MPPLAPRTLPAATLPKRVLRPRLLSSSPSLHRPFFQSCRLIYPPLRSRSLLLRIPPPFARPEPKTKALKSSFDPVVVLVALAVASVSSYIVTEYIYPAQSDSVEPSSKPSSESPSHDVVSDMVDTTEMPPGRPGNLTPEQEVKLKEFWAALYDILGVTEPEKLTNGVSRRSSTASSPTIGSDSPTPSKKKGRLSWLRSSDKKSGDSDESDAADDKYGLSKEFKRLLASESKENIRRSFWDMTKNDDPDALLLRFLRARKWEVHPALVMMINAFHWRSADMKVDEELIKKGEAHFLEQSENGQGAAKKDGSDIIKQFYMGKSIVHGIDNENRPITIVRARLHKPGEESERSIENYTVFVIETARLMLRPPVDTATIIFDLTGFGMSNMDYAPVKFMIKCFEANYPESLGSILVYKAPWIFSGIWKIIKGWLDPVVASKVHFCSNKSDLSEYISKSRMLKELDGEEDWEYEYSPPVPGENDRMKDTETRDKLLAERTKLAEEYERLTVLWAKDNDRKAGPQRTAIAEQLVANYWRLDPYVRARSLWDRTGVLGEGGKLNFYPEQGPAATKGANHVTAGSGSMAPPPQRDGAADQPSSNHLGVAKTNHVAADGESIYEDARSHFSVEID